MKPNASWFNLIGYLVISFSLVPRESMARGGRCSDGPECRFVGIVVLLIIIAAFIITLIESIEKHGFLKGFVKHNGVQFVTVSLLFGAGIVFTAVGANYLFGKPGVIVWFILGIFAIYYFTSRMKPPK